MFVVLIAPRVWQHMIGIKDSSTCVANLGSNEKHNPTARLWKTSTFETWVLWGMGRGSL